MKKLSAIFLLIIITFNLISCKKKERPVVETSGLTNITASSAASGGKVISDGDDAVVERGVCWAKNPNPTTADNKTSDGIGMGNFSSTLANLEPGTEYYVKAYAKNGAGTGYGTAVSFKTLGQIPSASVSQASGLTSSSARLSATVNPNLVTTSVSFEYGISTSYGASVSAIQSPVDGNVDVPVSVDISSLLPGTTYHYRVKAVNSIGTTYSNDLTFTTLGGTPSVTTPTSSAVTTSTITVSSYVNANYVSTTVTFEYGTSVSYGSSVPFAQNPLTGNSNVPVSATISSLNAGTAYHIRVKTENSLGVSYSNDITVTTLGQVPSVSTSSASNITTTTARLNGTINPKYLLTSGTFEYGKTLSYGSTVASTSPGSGSYTVSVSANITGLEPGTLYHFRLTAVNSLGTVNGTDLTFTTLGQGPLAVTNSATHLLTSSTYLNGSVNPNSLSTTVTFEYGTTEALGTNITAVQSPLSGSTSVPVSATLTGLTDGTTYYYRVKAENSLGISYGNTLTFVPEDAPASVTDIEGNVYAVVQIGTQFWMAENLKTTKYNDNTSIPSVTVGSDWIALTSPGYCWYDNNAATYKNTYGALYNFYAVATGKLCPTGWHVPSDTEFTTLTDYLGGTNIAGGKLKETGTVHWTSPNSGATNESGFTALPAGDRTFDGSFTGLGLFGVWWTSTPYNEIKPWYRSVSNTHGMVFVGNGSENYLGLSIRCVRD